MRYCLSEGVRLEALAETWAAFSAVSGDTLQLNTEAAAILELLAQGPMDEAAVCNVLASDTQTDPGAIGEVLRDVWDHLVSTGLVQADDGRAHNAG